jgi:DNA-binding transcriptional ArsR family regulator
MDAKYKELAREQASLCAVFGSNQRVLIAWTLGDDEVSVSDIAAQLDISLQNASQHLRLMKNKGILLSRRDGQTIYYRLAKTELLKSCPILSKAQQYQNDIRKKKKGVNHV